MLRRLLALDDSGILVAGVDTFRTVDVANVVKAPCGDYTSSHSLGCYTGCRHGIVWGGYLGPSSGRGGILWTIVLRWRCTGFSLQSGACSCMKYQCTVKIQAFAAWGNK